MLRIDFYFRQAHDAVSFHRLLGAHGRLLVEFQAFPDYFTGGDVGIGRELEQYGLQPCIVEFSVFVKHLGSGVGIGNRADEVVEAFRLVYIHHVTFHYKR